MSRPKNDEWSELALKAYLANPKATLRKLAAETGLTIGAISYHLHKLHKEGVVDFKRKRGRPLPVTVIDPKKSAAGKPGKGGDAMHPKRHKKADHTDELIELVVQQAKEREARGEKINAVNVVMHSPVRLTGAQRIG